MNVNKINICNMALSLVGADIISSMNEPSKEAKACMIFYENTKNRILASYDWPFASKKADLNKVKSFDNTKKNKFLIPTDCLVPREVLYKDDFYSFETQGDIIITEAEGVNLRYTASSDETYMFPPMVIDCIAYGLAGDIAIFLTDNFDMARFFASLSEERLEKAASLTALESLNGKETAIDSIYQNNIIKRSLF